MSKLDITERIEFTLLNQFHINRSTRCALEVRVFEGRVDFLAMDKKDNITCIEIKVTLADFKSSTGHNLLGNKNYYAVPEELVEDIKDLVPPHVGIMAITFYDANPYFPGNIKVVKNAKTIKHYYPKTVLLNIRENMQTALNSNIRRFMRDKLTYKYKYNKLKKSGDKK